MKSLDFDLNLLKVFNQLMIDRHVSVASEALGVTQPAVSNALKRLRLLAGDELFIRTAQGMQPTPVAEMLTDPIAYSLSTIASAIHMRTAFDPTVAKRTFRLGLTDIGEVFILPRLIATSRTLAPGISFTTVRNGVGSLRDEMEAGDVDLAIGLLPQLQGNFFRQRLLKQRYVVTMRNEHPLAKKKECSMADFCAQDHVLVLASGTGHNEVDQLMQRKGVERRICLTVPDFVVVGPLLQQSDLVATLPVAFAEKIAPNFGLTWLRHPVALPEVAIDAYWHRTMHRDPGSQWLRRLVFDLFST